MRAVSSKEASLNLEVLLTRMMDYADPAILVTESGEQVVMMPLDEYNAWRETHYLLASPANAARLRRSIVEAEAGAAEEWSMLKA